jgi:hypothetical protein
MGKLVNTTRVSSVAIASGFTIHDDLWAEGDSGEGVFVHDVHAICERARRPMSPTGATVDRNMLIFGH